MFKERKLKCADCNKVIETHESFLVELRLPGPLKMPYGALDSALYKQADRIICSNCKN